MSLDGSFREDDERRGSLLLAMSDLEEERTRQSGGSWWLACFLSASSSCKGREKLTEVIVTTEPCIQGHHGSGSVFFRCVLVMMQTE